MPSYTTQRKTPFYTLYTGLRRQRPLAHPRNYHPKLQRACTGPPTSKTPVTSGSQLLGRGLLPTCMWSASQVVRTNREQECSLRIRTRSVGPEMGDSKTILF